MTPANSAHARSLLNVSLMYPAMTSVAAARIVSHISVRHHARPCFSGTGEERPAVGPSVTPCLHLSTAGCHCSSAIDRVLTSAGPGSAALPLLLRGERTLSMPQRGPNRAAPCVRRLAAAAQLEHASRRQSGLQNRSSVRSGSLWSSTQKTFSSACGRSGSLHRTRRIRLVIRRHGRLILERFHPVLGHGRHPRWRERVVAEAVAPLNFPP